MSMIVRCTTRTAPSHQGGQTPRPPCARGPAAQRLLRPTAVPFRPTRLGAAALASGARLPTARLAARRRSATATRAARRARRATRRQHAGSAGSGAPVGRPLFLLAPCPPRKRWGPDQGAASGLPRASQRAWHRSSSPALPHPLRSAPAGAGLRASGPRLPDSERVCAAGAAGVRTAFPPAARAVQHAGSAAARPAAAAACQSHSALPSRRSTLFPSAHHQRQPDTPPRAVPRLPFAAERRRRRRRPAVHRIAKEAACPCGARGPAA